MKQFTTPFRARFSTLLFFSLFISPFTIPSLMKANDTIGFIEDFALAENREAILEQLNPGTREYYYFHAIHYQNESGGNLESMVTRSKSLTAAERLAIYGNTYFARLLECLGEVFPVLK